MKRRSIALLFTLSCAVLAARQGAADPAVSETNTMIIVDATGSMNEDFCEDDQGAIQSRLWCAKEDAKAGLPGVSVSTRYFALYILNGLSSSNGIVDLDDNPSNPRYFTNDRDEIIAAIDGVQSTNGATPLADSVCEAMSYLVKDDTSDKLYLNIYTDGGENVSLPESCGNYDYDHVNTFEFFLDASEAYPNSSVISNTDREDWAPFGSVIKEYGRAYQPNGKPEYDWAGGVLPGSWEWRTYYRTAWGDPREVGDEENYEWGPPISTGEVIMNIVAFVEETFPAKAAAASLLSTTVREDDVEAPAYYPARASGSSTATFSSLPATEDALFAGLAELTHGRYVKVPYGERAPILGDLNLDGEVNETDMRALLTWFGRAVDRYNQGSIDADIDLSAFVDNADMMYIRTNWTDTVKPAPIQGDLDYNWCVDQADLTQVMQWYGQPVNPGAQQSYYADINADGFIDDADVDIVEANMYQGCLNPPTCRDGKKNGSETDIDCGGPYCSKCVIWKKCIANRDCFSNNCQGGVCKKSTAVNVVASLEFFSEWGTGYCANLRITNNNSASTKSWTVGMNTNGGTIYTSWNGNFSSSSGNVTVTNVSWNGVIGGGQTINSSGFCANRNGGGTATITSASGSY